MTDEHLSLSVTELAARVRRERMHRGWDVVELERRSGIGRTTLYHLEKGHTQRVRSSTLAAIARAFEMEAGQLMGAGDDPRAVERRLSAEFDRATNPAVAEVARERPEVFEGWTQDDWEEINSQFGVGGQLTPLGALKAAEAINEKRETVRQLQVVLETHLREVAREVIETFYRMVQATSANAPSAAAMKEMADRLGQQLPAVGDRPAR
ncbi:helix-turn-helix protein [Caulifigura coniformis]|uniref:Helix-turn-helix protein n=1 Tax=Caulifigura coniformis TaxID=2527983 RepID=A0A517S7D2_9PLAN|nr:helix-turn-helix transcriptional regulator [Caulifigura coniformis]QDT52036.1 helix-turn-helix protein [Caulifigura coniformis]